jgi:hypothetical protein
MGERRICLVVGAGCSKETPTGLPLSGELSQQAHTQLVADGVLDDGECLKPDDLSGLADLVFAKTKSQRQLVSRMRPERFQNAKSNEGYRLAVALMLEDVVRTVVTLNYDLAVEHAISEVGAGDRISTIKEPSEWSRGLGRLVAFLHGNINSDWDRVILRTCQLNEEWKNGWEQVVVQAAMAAPTCVFAGLGSPAPVLTSSIAWVRSALTGDVYLADPGDRELSAFATELGIDDAHFIKKGWNAFVGSLASRVLDEHGRCLKEAATAHAAANGLPPTDLTMTCDGLARAGMVTLGSARAQWLRQEPGYTRLSDETANDLIADLLTALAAVVHETGASIRLSADGVVEFRNGQQVLGRLALASGFGALSADALSSRARRSLEASATVDPPPSVVILGATNSPLSAVSPPVDIAGEIDATSVAYVSREPVYLSLEDVRTNPTLVVNVWEAA